MRINNNLLAMNAHRQMGIATMGGAKSMEKLSSGFRINRAGDDAAGLAISEKMRGQIRGLNQASRNAQDGISMIQTAEGALNETHAILQRMRELAVQAANDTNTASDRLEIQREIDQLTEEVDRIGNTTEFNTKKLLDGSSAAISSFASGINAVFIRDGLRVMDVFGQKEVMDGNFRVEIMLSGAGKGQIQKSNIMRLKHDQSGVGDTGQIAGSGAQLRNIQQFWDANGNFLVDEPQTITLVQGDGTRAAFTIYGNDTLSGVATKINDAIASERTRYGNTIEVGKGLGQSGVAGIDGTNQNNFARYTTETHDGGIDAVSGTIVVSSAIAGRQGEIRFVGNEAVLRAFGFSTIQQSEENTFKYQVYNAHSGSAATALTSGTVTGNRLVGVIHSNVDVEFDNMAGANAVWSPEKGWEIQSGTKVKTHVHLADNSTVFQVGANQLQDMTAAIGDMRAHALGINNLQVYDREAATRSIGQLDQAIDRVSEQRGKLGALQNRLEHTIRNLDTSRENLQAAESRIRDVDMAGEMMTFTRNNILQQAAISMLAQANMAPQSVLQLLG